MNKPTANTFLFYSTFLLCLVLLIPQGFVHGFSRGIDPSWGIATHLAFKKNYIFGIDYVFTLGPLGIFASRNSFESAYFPLALHDLFMLVVISFTLFQGLKNLKNYQLIIPVIATFTLGDWAFRSNLSLLQSFLLLFLIFHSLKNKALLPLFLASILSVVMFYTKLNAGLFALVIFAIHCLYIGFKENRTQELVLGVFSYLLCLSVSLLLLPVSLFEYIESSIEIVKGFHDSMFLPILTQYESQLYFAWVFSIITAITLALKTRSIVSNFQNFIVILFTAMYGYITYKQSFVRADVHTLAFFSYFPLCLCLLHCFLEDSFKRSIGLILCACLVISIYNRPERLSPSYFLERQQSIAKYFKQVSRGIKDTKPKKKYAYPPEFKQIIGNQTVDAVPVDAGAIYHAGMNYSSRPIPQTYQCYNSYLDKLNASFYRGSKAPEFIIFEHGCIDGRYCFADESKTKIAISENYKIKSQLHGKLVLKKKPANKFFRKVAVKQSRKELGQKINIPKDEIHYLSAKIEYSLLGKIRSFLYQPPELEITINTESGKTHSFRAIRPILEGGVLASHFVNSIDDSKSFFESDFSSLDRVSSIQISSKQPWAVEESIKTNLETYNIFKKRAVN